MKALAALALLAALAACHEKEDVESCRRLELRVNVCDEHESAPTDLDRSSVADECSSSGFRHAIAPYLACYEQATCEQLESCMAPYEEQNPFGVVH